MTTFVGVFNTLYYEPALDCVVENSIRALYTDLVLLRNSLHQYNLFNGIRKHRLSKSKFKDADGFAWASIGSNSTEWDNVHKKRRMLARTIKNSTSLINSSSIYNGSSPSFCCSRIRCKNLLMRIKNQMYHQRCVLHFYYIWLCKNGIRTAFVGEKTASLIKLN